MGGLAHRADDVGIVVLIRASRAGPYHLVREYASPREPNDALLVPLQQAGFTIIPVGDARAPQEMLFATASGHEAGNAV